MPQRDAHEVLSWLLFGNKMTKMHEMMDFASQFLGPNHRAVGHDPVSVAMLALLNAFTIASNSTMRGGNFWDAFGRAFAQNAGAGLLHIAQDETFSSLKRAAGNASQYDRPIDQILRDIQKIGQSFNPLQPSKQKKTR